MKKFSLEKYLRWCRDNNEPFYPWAIECAGKEVKGNMCCGYIIHKEWVVRGK